MIEFLTNPTVVLIVGVIASIVVMISLEIEKEGVATTAISLSMALILFTYWETIWLFLKNNSIDLLLYLIAYLILGLIWSLIKWTFYVKDIVNKYIRLKSEFIVKYPEFDGEQYEWVRDLSYYLRDNGIRISIAKTLNELALSVLPLSSEKKSLIVSWISYWPLSLLATLLNNPFRRLFTSVYELFSSSYDRITSSEMKKIIK
jgi:hypothetical protein